MKKLMEQIALAEDAQRKAYMSKTGGDDHDDMELGEEDKTQTQTKLVNESEEVEPEVIARLKSLSESFVELNTRLTQTAMPDQSKQKFVTIVNAYNTTVVPLLTKMSGVIWKSDQSIMITWQHLKELVDSLKNNLIKYDAVKSGFCCDNTKENIMKDLLSNLNMLELRRDLYAILLNMKPRVFTNKVTTKTARKERTRELPKLTVDKQRIKSHVETHLKNEFPSMEPIYRPKFVIKEVTKPPVVTSAPVKKDTYIQAQEAFFGYGRQQNKKEALELYLDAERRGIYQASICLGKCYMKGDGVSKDYEKALAHFRKASSAQNTDVMSRGDGYYWIGYLHMHNHVGTSNRTENLKVAVEHFEKAATQSKHHDAMTDLGIIAEQGLLGPADHKKAKKLYTEAADLGNPRGMDQLGVLLLKLEDNPNLDQGRTNENYHKLAYERFKAAQELGHKKSMKNLGIMYLHGMYVEKDLVNAKALFKLAASGDNPEIEAKYYLAYFGLKEASMSQDEKKFEKVSDELRYVLALDPEHSDAHYYLGFLYENGLGTDKDMRVALRHYQRATETDPNNTKAKCKVADFYMTGEGLSYPDRAKALQLYQEAAAHDNSDALLALG